MNHAEWAAFILGIAALLAAVAAIPHSPSRKSWVKVCLAVGLIACGFALFGTNSNRQVPAPAPSAASSPTSLTKPSDPIVTPSQPAVDTVYKNRKLNIPPMNCGSAMVDFAIPKVSVTSDLPVIDLELNGCYGTWESNDQIADLGKASPSYSECKSALSNPINLATQDFVAGHGYCFELTGGQGSPIAYAKFNSSTPSNSNGSTTEVSMVATLWHLS